MSTTCDKPIFRGNGNILSGPTGHCALPQNHSDSCKLPEELQSTQDTLPKKCPYDSWHLGEYGELTYQNPLDELADPFAPISSDEC